MTAAPGNESPIDRAIREAADRGEFDNLESAGKPLDSLDAGDDWWIKQYAQREGVLGADFLPESLRIRKEAETLIARYLDQRSETVVRREVDLLNLRIRAEIQAPTSAVPLHMALLEPDAIVARWSVERAAKHSTPPPPTAVKVPRKRWWQR